MRSVPCVCLSKRLRGPAFVAAIAVLSVGTFAVSGCGSGLHGTASAGVPAAALTVAAAPKLGYAWNETDQTLRPITGVPGSAQFGESVTPAGAYVLGVADSGGNFAILLGSAQQVYRMALPSGTPVQLSAQAAPGASIRISPQGARGAGVCAGRHRRHAADAVDRRTGW